MLNDREMRSALGKFATGVIVLTARNDAGEPLGMTISSFNSVSLDPPLVLFSIHRKSLGFPAWQCVQRCAIHVLGSHQEALANRFARSNGDKWVGIESTASMADVPLLRDCPVIFECEAYARHDGGDHEIFVVRIVRIQETQTSNVLPLVFHGGKFLDTSSGSTGRPSTQDVSSTRGYSVL